MLPQEPTFQPVMLTAAQVATVPEDASSPFGDDGGDDAQAFMARNAAASAQRARRGEAERLRLTSDALLSMLVRLLAAT